MCPTAAYVAGAGESAMVHTRVSCNIAAGSVVNAKPAYNSTLFSSWATTGNYSATAGYVQVVTAGTLPLTSGTSYVFSTGYWYSGTTAATMCWCHTMVQIIKA
jgi:hypothetical protein